MYLPIGILCMMVSMALFYIAFHPATDLQGKSVTPGNVLASFVSQVKGN